MFQIDGIQHRNPIIIAEIGGNHGGSVTEAIRLGQLAAANGADIIKYQTYTADGLVNGVLSPDRHLHFRRLELDPGVWPEIAAAITEAGKLWMTSIWDEDQADALLPLQPAVKVGSGDLTHHRLLQRFVETGKPLILSTAMADQGVVNGAVDACLSADESLMSDGRLCLLQCTAQYDHPSRVDADLAVMDTYRTRFAGISVGFSSHSSDLDVPLLALARGAEVLEVHFTDDKSGSFRDLKLSVTPEELSRLREFADKISLIMGSPAKGVHPLEKSEVATFRRALYPRVNLPCGHEIAESDLVALRPCVGIPAEKYPWVIGKVLLRNVEAYRPLSFSDLLES